jgi:hypothetical protein
MRLFYTRGSDFSFFFLFFYLKLNFTGRVPLFIPSPLWAAIPDRLLPPLAAAATTTNERVVFSVFAHEDRLKHTPLDVRIRIFDHVVQWAAEDAARLCPAAGAGPPPTSEEYRSAYAALGMSLGTLECVKYATEVQRGGDGTHDELKKIYPALSAAARAAWDRLWDIGPRLPPVLRCMVYSRAWIVPPFADKCSARCKERIVQDCAAMLRDEALWGDTGPEINRWIGSMMAAQLRNYTLAYVQHEVMHNSEADSPHRFMTVPAGGVELNVWNSLLTDARLARHYRHVTMMEALDTWDSTQRQFKREGATQVRPRGRARGVVPFCFVSCRVGGGGSPSVVMCNCPFRSTSHSFISCKHYPAGARQHVDDPPHGHEIK